MLQLDECGMFMRRYVVNQEYSSYILKLRVTSIGTYYWSNEVHMADIFICNT
jgi:hypothetical protein